MFRYISLLTLSLCLVLPAWAQRPDKPGSSDHPLLSRFEGASIDKFQELQFDRYVLPLGPAVDNKTLGETQVLEGKVTKIHYLFWEEPKPSLFQLYKSYEQIFSDRDVDVLFTCFKETCRDGGADLVKTAADIKALLNGFMGFGDHAYTAAKVSQDGRDYYLALYFKQERANVAYEIHVVEVEAMATDKISMADISQELKETGKQAFYGLYFDTGKATLTASSQSDLALLAEYLRENSDDQYYIVGHTDNVGSYATNQSLAQARAQSVVAALKEQFNLKVGNLQAVGVGPVSPVATNSSPDGRAKNRRVELVIK